MEDGGEVRPVDVCHDEVVAEQRRRYLSFLKVGVPVAAAVGLLMPALHLGAAAVAPLLAVVHLVTVRVVLVGRSRRLLGTARRLFHRWITRLSFLWVGVPGWGLSAVPLLGVLAGAGTFAGLTALVHHYTLWSLERERSRQPLAVWEKLVLAALAILTVALLVLVVVAAVVLGAAVSWVAERMRAA